MAKHILMTDLAKKVTLFSTEGLSTSELLQVFSSFILRKPLSKLKKNNSLVEIKMSKEEKHVMHLYLEEEIPDEVFKEFAQTDNIGINFKPIINREFVTCNGRIGLIGLGRFLQLGTFDTKTARNYINNCEYLNVPSGRYQVNIYPLSLSGEEIAYKRANFFHKIKVETESKFGIGSYEKVLKRRKIKSKSINYSLFFLNILLIYSLISRYLPENIYKLYLNSMSDIFFVIFAVNLSFILFFPHKKTAEEVFVDSQENNLPRENFPTMVATMHRISD